MVSVNVKQCFSVEFCVKFGKSATETCGLLKKVYGDVYLVLRFSILKGLKREGKRLETISTPVVPAHQKQKLKSKKSVKLFDKIVA